MIKKISIVLCTYNEVNYIENTIKLISETFENVEIIIVDDGSTDSHNTLLGRGDVSQAIIYIFELSAKAVPVKFQWAGAAIEDEDVHAFEQQFIGM